jgi:Ca2+-transporting ATPase
MPTETLAIPTTGPGDLPPYRRPAADVLGDVRSDLSTGLSGSTAAERLLRDGRNELAAQPRVPWWRRLAAQFGGVLILILVASAIVAFVASRELKTPLVVLTVVVLNAVVGFIHENRAERSLEALRTMLVDSARVRRDGSWINLPAAELVVGDIVTVEAGDRIPADGRLLATSSLEIEEAALTGESQPTVKHTAELDREAGLGDRYQMAFMNTTVTRGRGEMVVTATGMNTEIGRIAGLLRGTVAERTPLQRQLDALARSLAKLAFVIVIAVFAIGLARGQSFGDLMLTAVALAVASIPEGLPAVTVVTLAIGVSTMTRRNAIVKRLSSVETLGCTSVICSDKTGTLTVNEMTAVELFAGFRSRAVTGTGYEPVGSIETFDDDHPGLVDAALTPMALCSDATVRATGDADEPWQLVGDPTEGALVVLATKAGVDVDDLRRAAPRLADVPFDSANKFMLTVHESVSAAGQRGVVVYVKGAPDVLMARSSMVIGSDGAAAPINEHHEALAAHNERLAGKGLRVLAVALRQLSIEAWDEFAASAADPLDLAEQLTLVALVGIVDPPRPEAQQAIAEAHAAGISVRMITGDHAATATAIARQLGLTGRSLTGAELQQMDDDALREAVRDTAVFARVSPEHKLRLVTALQQNGNVVAMTGDGVNDAPALKKADIGVAMGITGTEVSKQAATMVLTDDNFATIVAAVRQGRTIYDNIVKFVRFQLSTTLGFAVLFLMAALLGIADGKPFTAIAILWVNLIMDGPPAMALGVDPQSGDVMRQPARPTTERILTRARWLAVSLSAVVMACGTLVVLAWAPGEAAAGAASVAGTMAFNTFVLFQFFNILNARSDHRTVFSRDTLRNKALWWSLAVVLVLQVGVTYVGPLQRLFDTTSISAAQWLVCVLVAATVVLVEETRKFIVRREIRS